MMWHFFIKKLQNKKTEFNSQSFWKTKFQILAAVGSKSWKTELSKKQNQNSILKAVNLQRPPAKKRLTFCNRIGTNEKGGLHHLLSYILITYILIKRLYLFINKDHAAQRTTNLYRKTILIHKPMLNLTSHFLDPERGDDNCWHTNTKHIKLKEIRNR